MPTVASTPAPAPPSRLRRWLRGELPQLALLLGLMLVARSSLANHYVVPSGSMQHTLQVGDRVAVDMRAYGLRLPVTDTVLWSTGQPRRGEVVVFDSPADGTRLIKRVVAVGGDRVALRDGHLSINGRALAKGPEEEDFGAHVARLDLHSGGGPDLREFTLPPDTLLVLGDHRGNSADGRYFGLVRRQAVYGRAVAVFYRRGQGLAWRAL